MKMEQTECSESSAYKIQTPGNYPEENIQHTQRKSEIKNIRPVNYESLQYQQMHTSTITYFTPN